MMYSWEIRGRMWLQGILSKKIHDIQLGDTEKKRDILLGDTSCKVGRYMVEHTCEVRYNKRYMIYSWEIQKKKETCGKKVGDT